MIDFKVKVVRGYQDEKCTVLDGWYISKVYAIQDDSFLVYDDFNGYFEWVNINSKIVRMEHGEEVVEHLVTLWEEEA